MSGDDADIVMKIQNYEDQLEQVEAALAINPSHDDLLSIKANLQEILQILKSRTPSLDATHETVISSKEPENCEKVKTVTENIEKEMKQLPHFAKTPTRDEVVQEMKRNFCHDFRRQKPWTKNENSEKWKINYDICCEIIKLAKFQNPNKHLKI